MDIKCYHGTSSVNVQLIISGGFDINKCTNRDDHWLGKGIYFFIDKEYAYWWANFKHKGRVIKSNIVCDDKKYLNLDNPSEFKAFSVKCKEYANKYQIKFKNPN